METQLVGTSRLIVSPHLDDALLSCFTVLARRLEEGAGEVQVVTLFAGLPPVWMRPRSWDRAAGIRDVRSHVQARREEDRRALAAQDAACVHLDFLDAQYRSGPVAREDLERVLREIARPFDEVWIPAGVGGHVDHVLARDAALAATAGKRRVLYGDLPYAIRQAWPGLAPGDGDAQAPSGPGSAPSPHPACVRPPRVHRLSPGDRQLKLQAVESYATQIPALVQEFGRWFHDPELFGWEISWEVPDPPLVPSAAAATGSIPAWHWERVYRKEPDPWGYESRWYERRKYSLTVAGLPRERYRRAFEPGCSIGILSEGLAARCDELLSSDCAEGAVAQARERLRRFAHVRVERMYVPSEWPPGRFDLIVVSEFAHYLAPVDVEALIDRVIASLEPDGQVVVVHHRSQSDTGESGDSIRARFCARAELLPLVRHEEAEFLLDVLATTSAAGAAGAGAAAGPGAGAGAADAPRFLVRRDAEGGEGGARPAGAGKEAGEAVAAAWWQRLTAALAAIAAIVPPGSSYVLIDNNQWGDRDIVPRRMAIPFLEAGGEYAGIPADSAYAIRELERLREAGASHLVIGWPGFWWNDVFPDFMAHLRARYDVCIESADLLVFRLDPAAGPDPPEAPR